MKLCRATALFLTSALAWTRCISNGEISVQGGPPQKNSGSNSSVRSAKSDQIPELIRKKMRSASLVNLPPPCDKLEAHSGFIPVSDQKNRAYLFFLLIKSETNPDKKPLLLWLQGSPGQSALFGQFLENGPLGINERGTLYRRNHSLISNFNIIYLDQPAGSGYSFDKTKRYAATLEQSSVQVISFLRRFLQIFPEYKNRQFFVAGESYGARSAIGVAHKMLTRQPQELPLRLKGAMLGAGFVFPLLEIINSTDYLYCSGLLDEQGRTRYSRQLQKIQDFVDTGNFTAAAGLLCGTILNMHSVAEENLFEELTGFEHQGSIVRPLVAREIERYMEYANSTQFKRLVHIASSRILDATRSQVEMTLAVGDFFTDKTTILVEVLNKLHVLFYTAQLDALFPAKNIERSFEKLEWRGSAAFKTAVRRPWYEANNPTNKLLGYEKTAGAVMYNTVLFAGHDISLDQSAAVSDMYGRFLSFVAMGPMNGSRHKCGTSEQFC